MLYAKDVQAKLITRIRAEARAAKELLSRLGNGGDLLLANDHIDQAVRFASRHVASMAAPTERFCLYESTLGGGPAGVLYQLPLQQINHANPSPDGRWVAFTVYDAFVGGIAQESGGSLNTEIRLLNLSTLDVTVAVPPVATAENAWPSWWPDSKSFIYKSTQNTPSHHEAIWQYDLSTDQTTLFYDPLNLNITSSNVNVDGDVVFAGTTPVPSGGYQGYLYTLVGGARTQLTNPPVTPGVVLGDSAPIWAPNKEKIVCLRQMSRGIFQLVIINVGPGPHYANLGELVIPQVGSASAVDGIAQWASNGRVLVFYHIDPENMMSSGIYTINPDGTNREYAAGLPAEYLNTLVNFMPGGGSSLSAPIIVSGQLK